jgi:hypothetical protein
VTPMSETGARVKLHAKYAGPIAVATIVALAPVWLLAMRATPPQAADQLGSADRLCWLMVALSVVGTFALVGGVAATRTTRSQLTAVGDALLGMLRAIVPCLLAVLAIVLGTLALVVPGIVLIALLAGTGAHAGEDVPATTVLTKAIAAARPRVFVIGAIAVGMIALDIGLVYLLHHFIVVLPAKPKPEQLVVTVTFVRAVATVLVGTSPLFATALAVTASA